MVYSSTQERLGVLGKAIGDIERFIRDNTKIIRIRLEVFLHKRGHGVHDSGNLHIQRESGRNITTGRGGVHFRNGKVIQVLESGNDLGGIEAGKSSSSQVLARQFRRAEVVNITFTVDDLWPERGSING